MHFYFRVVIGILVSSLLPVDLVGFVLVLLLAALVVKSPQKLLVLLYGFLLVLFFALAILLVCYNLRGGFSSHFNESSRLEPAVGDL